MKAKNKAMITEKLVENRKPPAKDQTLIWDAEIRNFGLRITEKGAKSFILNFYPPQGGKQKRMTIGRWPECSADKARTKALALKNRIENGEDPLEEKLEPDTLTVTQLCNDYMERHALKNKRASSIRNDRSMIETIIKPRIGKLTVSGIGRREIEALHHELKGTPYRANRLLSLLSKMFALAVAWKWRLDNPVKGIPKYDESRREAWLTAEQLQKLEAALDRYPGKASANAVKLMILAGSRAGEVLGARWSDFDLPRATWTKPSHATKQRTTEHVPLNSLALALLKKMAARKKGKSEYLFPGRGTGKGLTSVRRCWIQCLKAAGLAEPVQVRGKKRLLTRWRPMVRLHDLRHSFASHLINKGESLYVVGRLLGHRRAETTARYSHVSDQVMRQASERFSEVLK